MEWIRIGDSNVTRKLKQSTVLGPGARRDSSQTPEKDRIQWPISFRRQPQCHGARRINYHGWVNIQPHDLVRLHQGEGASPRMGSTPQNGWDPRLSAVDLITSPKVVRVFYE